jgi:hypothetical protein
MNHEQQAREESAPVEEPPSGELGATAQPSKPSALTGRRRLIAAGLLAPPLVMTLRSHYAAAKTAKPCASLMVSVMTSRHVCGH